MIKVKRQGAINRELEKILKEGELMDVDLTLVDRDEKQPRSRQQVFHNLQELANSIKNEGLINPPLYRVMGDGRYTIIVGERRTEAVKLNGDGTIRAFCRTFDKPGDQELIVRIQYAENDDELRKGLTLVDEARYFDRQLIENFNNDEALLANAIGKSRSYISQKLKIKEGSAKLLDAINGHISDMTVAYKAVNWEKECPEAAEKWLAEATGSEKPSESSIRKSLSDAIRRSQSDRKPIKGFKIAGKMTVGDLQKRVGKKDESGNFIGAVFVSAVLDKPFDYSFKLVENMGKDDYKTFLAVIDFLREKEIDKSQFVEAAKEIKKTVSANEKSDK